MLSKQSSAIFRNSALVLTVSLAAYAQAPTLITQPIDESRLFTLAGNTRAEAIAANDQGRVPDNMPIEHILLQLQHSAQQEESVNTLIDQLHDPNSANYHHWLTASEFGLRFGLAQQDLSTVAGWLQSHGITVNSTYANGMLMDFSGTAGQIREAFHTEIHNLMVDGTPHIANMSDPQIPAALAPVIAGIVSLHNFWPHPMFNARANYTFTTNGITDFAVAPGDLATIYDLNPQFKAGTAGTGETVVVVEDSNLFTAADWTDFRKAFGLDRFTSGKLNTVHPAPAKGKNNCADPGVNGDSTEATLDAEYASAAAPNATISVATCADTATTFGGLIAIENMVYRRQRWTQRMRDGRACIAWDCGRNLPGLRQAIVADGRRRPAVQQGS
jgi:subtilase family serine protease